jgi:chemotaxis protein MotB
MSMAPVSKTHGRKGDTLLFIRRKRRRSTEMESHGAWKIAYADFVTAMMAFFLLMWLINTTTQDQKNAMADYFNPYQQDENTTPKPQGGIISIFDGGNMAGQQMDQDKEGNPQTTKDQVIITKEQFEKIKEKMDASKTDKEDVDGFKQVRDSIDSALERMPELRGLANNVQIDEVPEGLRIQIVDKDDFSMFQLGSAALTPRARTLVRMLAPALAQVPNRIAVSGHTDSLQMGGNAKYSNWELSSDRANAARREMVDASLDIEKFARVEGRADSDPLIKENLKDPRNRRISILVLKRSVAPISSGAKVRKPEDTAEMMLKAPNVMNSLKPAGSKNP